MPPADSEVEVLKSIEGKLDQLLRLAALQLASNMKQVQAIQTLSAAGFERRVIADLLGTTPGTVSVTLAKAKAKQKPRDNEVPKPVVSETQVS